MEDFSMFDLQRGSPLPQFLTDAWNLLAGGPVSYMFPLALIVIAASALASRRS